MIDSGSWLQTDTRDSTRVRTTNVLIAVGGLHYAGAEQQVRLLACQLPKDRFRVHVACFGAAPELLDQTTRANVSVHILPRGARLIWPLVVLRELIRIVRAERIDVVHGFLPTFEILVPCLRLLKPGLRVVSSRRNVDDSRTPREVALLALTSLLSSAIVANGEEVAESVRRMERVRRDIAVIPNGLPMPADISQEEAEAARRGFGLAADAFVIAYVAHFRDGKGHTYLLPLAEELRATVPNVRFLLAGHVDGSDTYRRNAAAFREQVRRRGLEGCFTVLGLQRDIRSVWAAADAALNLSDCEGMSNALMEAMALRRPVVASQAGAIAEMLHAGREGFIVPRGDVASAAQALRLLAQRPDLRAGIGEAGRCRIAQDFSVGRMVERYAHLYEAGLG